MIKLLILVAMTQAISFGFPTGDKTESPDKSATVAPPNTEDLKAAETFYTGYNVGYSGYPSLGLSLAPHRGGYGWRGDYQPIAGPVYGTGYEIGYAGIPVGGYGSFVPAPLVTGGAPLTTGAGGGYGWRQGGNRWAV